MCASPTGVPRTISKLRQRSTTQASAHACIATSSVVEVARDVARRHAEATAAGDEGVRRVRRACRRYSWRAWRRRARAGRPGCRCRGGSCSASATSVSSARVSAVGRRKRSGDSGVPVKSEGSSTAAEVSTVPLAPGSRSRSPACRSSARAARCRSRRACAAPTRACRPSTSSTFWRVVSRGVRRRYCVEESHRRVIGVIELVRDRKPHA